MNATVREWLTKTENDHLSAVRELAVRDHPNPDLVMFLCQQSIEKLMKGALIARGVTPPHTHRLTDLSRRLAALECNWSWNAEELEWLTAGAVDYRDPGGSAAPADAVQAVDLAERLRAVLLALLEFPETAETEQNSSGAEA